LQPDRLLCQPSNIRLDCSVTRLVGTSAIIGALLMGRGGPDSLYVGLLGCYSLMIWCLYRY